jgi:cytosine/adenosine deaminase-related metal-dependent hydrolase
MMNSGAKIIQAKWVAPMDRPILREAGVLINSGRIAAVDSSTELRRQNPKAEVIDLPKHILLPGLINAHVHLELSHCRAGDSPGGTFADWILSMRDRMRIDPQNLEIAVTRAVNYGIAQCLKFGVTCVGDITSFIEISRRAIRQSPLGAVSYGEALGLGKLRSRFEMSIPRAVDRREESDRLRIGLSPHAPYTVDLPGFVQCLRLAREQNLPLATHLAENDQESDFLTNHSGIFREIWNKLGLWQDDVTTYRGPPIQFAKSIGLLDYPTLLAHVNYCDDEEMNLLANGRASVVYCPRTHAYFGHPPHRWREMLARGINVAVGTDSCASSPDLNLVDDLRLLRRIAPEVSAETIWEMATIRAARAIGMQEEVGSITTGKRADLIAFEANSNDPLGDVLGGSTPVTALWLDGIQNLPSLGSKTGGKSTPA